MLSAFSVIFCELKVQSVKEETVRYDAKSYLKVKNHPNGLARQWVKVQTNPKASLKDSNHHKYQLGLKSILSY